MSIEPTIVYVCPHCFSMGQSPGRCSDCGGTRVECQPGDASNPSRKPPMDREGRILSRAPLWWLAHSAPYLRDKIKKLISK